jgi:hypothetical protein
MKKMTSTIALLAIAGNMLMAGGDIATVEPVVVEETVSDQWEFYASINGWMPTISAELPMGPTIDITFKDIIDNMRLVALGTVGTQKGKWGLLTDVVYLNLAKDTFIPLEPSRAITDIQLKAWIVTPMATYRFLEEDQWTLDLMGGARYLSIDIPLNFNYISQVDGSFHVWDAVVGLRGNYAIDEKWFVPFHFDVGAGDTDLTWQAFAGVGYKYENFDVIAGYRYLDWEFDESGTGGKVLDQLTVDGPMLGLKYYF